MSRPIKPMALPQLELAPVAPAKLEFRWVAPSELRVEEEYQRQLGEQSIRLIRKIVAAFDWTRFKPPVVAETAEGLFVIDGQHTAIAAASHPAVDKIPVMVIDAPYVIDRASAFVGHNRDRLALTQAVLHYAALAAGDEDAQTLQQVCERAGARILRTPPAVSGDYKIGDTMAIVTIRSLINRRGAMNARIALQALVEAHCAPVEGPFIKAIEILLYEAEYRGEHKPADLTSAVMRLGEQAKRDAQVFAAGHGVPMWRGLVVVLAREARRGRRRAA
jgi:hypothetical protein